MTEQPTGALITDASQTRANADESVTPDYKNPSKAASGMRLAYADPPYPGKAYLYPENTEVDHVALIARLADYDGWALSTDETALSYVLSLCPLGVRVLAWCRNNAPPLLPFPIRSWEPVIVAPARTNVEAIRSYLVSPAPTGWTQREGLTGQKTPAFCEWVIRAMGADRGDTLDDIFPGTGVMGETWRTFQSQPPLFTAGGRHSQAAKAQLARKQGEPLPGLPAPAVVHKVRQEKRSAA